MNIKCKKIVGGVAKGESLYSTQPINFLGMVNIKTGEIKDQAHGLNNKTIKNKILIFPNAIGSSVGAYTIFSLKNNDAAPNGIICTNNADITTASGCAISNIPLAVIDKKDLKKLLDILEKSNAQNKEIILDTEAESIFVLDNKPI